MDEWLIYSHEHQGWWLSHGNGYTIYANLAGRYSEQDAAAIVEQALYGWNPQPDGTDELPHEVMVPARSYSLLTEVTKATVRLIKERAHRGVRA